MRDIKFSYILQHDDTGRFIEKVYEYVDIFNGTARKYFDDLPRYFIVAKRQCTGLHDKNGKEIYEGDIMMSSGKSHLKRVIEYRNGKYWFLGSDGKTNYFGSPSFCKHFFIVGNIYENSDLINPSHE